MPIPADKRPLAREPPHAQSVAYSACPACACRCGIEVTLENGQVRFVQGTRSIRSTTACWARRGPPGS